MPARLGVLLAVVMVGALAGCSGRDDPERFANSSGAPAAGEAKEPSVAPASEAGRPSATAPARSTRPFDAGPATQGSRTAPGEPGPTMWSAEVPKYDRVATMRCLEGRGVAIAEIKPLDPRIQALRDLAQSDSFEVRVGQEVVGVAFTESGSASNLLRDLLEAPDDLYRVVVNRNVVLLYKPSAGEEFRTTMSCLSE